MEQIFDAERAIKALPLALASSTSGAACANAALLMRVLDEIDYGLLLVTAAGTLRYANQLGLQELTSGGPLLLEHGRLHTRAPLDQVALHATPVDASHGKRRLLCVGHNGGTIGSRGGFAKRVFVFRLRRKDRGWRGWSISQLAGPV